MSKSPDGPHAGYGAEQAFLFGVLIPLAVLVGYQRYLSYKMLKSFALSHHGSTRNALKLQRVFHIILPIMTLTMLIYSIDPEGVRGIWRRPSISLFRAIGGVAGVAMVVYFTIVAVQTVYTRQFARARRQITLILYSLFVIFTIIELCAMFGRIFSHNRVWDQLRYINVALFMFITVNLVAFFTWRLATTMEFHQKRLNMAKNDKMAKSMKRTRRHLRRVFHIVKVGYICSLIMVPAELYLAYKSGQQDDPVPLNDEEARSYSIRHVLVLIIQIIIAYIALIASWIGPSSKVTGSQSHSHSGSTRDLNSSNYNLSYDARSQSSATFPDE